MSHLSKCSMQSLHVTQHIAAFFRPSAKSSKNQGLPFTKISSNDILNKEIFFFSKGKRLKKNPVNDERLSNFVNFLLALIEMLMLSYCVGGGPRNSQRAFQQSSLATEITSFEDS